MMYGLKKVIKVTKENKVFKVIKVIKVTKENKVSKVLTDVLFVIANGLLELNIVTIAI